MVPFRLTKRIIGRQRKNGPDRQRKQGLGWLEISVTSGRTVPLCFGVFLIRVSICQGGSSPPEKSNYRKKKEDPPRSASETGTRLYGIIAYVWLFRAIRFGIFLVRVSIYPGGSVSPDNANSWVTKGESPRPTEETGTRLSGHISYVWSFHSVRFRGFPYLCTHLSGRFGFARYDEL